MTKCTPPQRRATGKTKIPKRPAPSRSVAAAVKGDRILRMPQVRDRVPWSPATIYRKMADGTFPKGVKLGPNSRGWTESSIDRWIAEREAAAE